MGEGGDFESIECVRFSFVFFCLSISGTFAQDTLRLMRDVQSGTLDDVIRIHEDLCTVVFSTVSAYSVWFVLHWFTYGASLLVAAIYISEEILLKAPKVNLVYLGFLFVCLLYLFLLPCVCAAKITSHCAGKIIGVPIKKIIERLVQEDLLL